MSATRRPQNREEPIKKARRHRISPMAARPRRTRLSTQRRNMRSLAYPPFLFSPDVILVKRRRGDSRRGRLRGALPVRAIVGHVVMPLGARVLAGTPSRVDRPVSTLPATGANRLHRAAHPHCRSEIRLNLTHGALFLDVGVPSRFIKPFPKNGSNTKAKTDKSPTS